MQVDSPYNLYQHAGLPPTPISNPGLASIDAALNPNDTDYYYYALGTDGLHHFSTTLAEHNAFVNSSLLWRLNGQSRSFWLRRGDMERLKMAVLYGADAVYLAGESFGMRAFAGNFSDEELPEAVAFAHEHGVRVHCTVNTMPRNDEVSRLPEHLERLADGRGGRPDRGGSGGLHPGRGSMRPAASATSPPRPASPITRRLGHGMTWAPAG